MQTMRLKAKASNDAASEKRWEARCERETRFGIEVSEQGTHVCGAAQATWSLQ
jgi:hypothetical protein